MFSRLENFIKKMDTVQDRPTEGELATSVPTDANPEQEQRPSDGRSLSDQQHQQQPDGADQSSGGQVAHSDQNDSQDQQGAQPADETSQTPTNGGPELVKVTEEGHTGGGEPTSEPTGDSQVTSIKQDNTSEIIEAIERLENESEPAGKTTEQEQRHQQAKPEKSVSVGTATVPVTEVQEVSSSTRIDNPPKSMRAPRRASYQSSRSFAGGFQNYGLAYLPYKSNFEPSEDARRRADEFFKTLKL